MYPAVQVTLCTKKHENEEKLLYAFDQLNPDLSPLLYTEDWSKLPEICKLLQTEKRGRCSSQVYRTVLTVGNLVITNWLETPIVRDRSMPVYNELYVHARTLGISYSDVARLQLRNLISIDYYPKVEKLLSFSGRPFNVIGL